MTSHRNASRFLLPFALCLLATGACSKNATIKGSSAATSPGSVPSPKGSPTEGPGVHSISDDGALFVAPGLEKSKRKTLPLLKSSIENCLQTDAKVFALNAAMEVPRDVTPRADAEGRIAFLEAEYSKSSDGTLLTSVLDVEKTFLDDPASLRRASVYSSALDDFPYMVATQTVANVVAWNLDPKKLDCAGTPAARAFLERCLLGEEDAILDAAAEKLGHEKACGSSDLFTKRKAVATLLASYLFLRVR